MREKLDLARRGIRAVFSASSGIKDGSWRAFFLVLAGFMYSLWFQWIDRSFPFPIDLRGRGVFRSGCYLKSQVLKRQ